MQRAPSAGMHSEETPRSF